MRNIVNLYTTIWTINGTQNCVALSIGINWECGKIKARGVEVATPFLELKTRGSHGFMSVFVLFCHHLNNHFADSDFEFHDSLQLFLSTNTRVYKACDTPRIGICPTRADINIQYS